MRKAFPGRRDDRPLPHGVHVRALRRLFVASPAAMWHIPTLLAVIVSFKGGLAADPNATCAKNDHQCGGVGYGGVSCCDNPGYACQIDEDPGEEAGFMRCVRAAQSPPPMPPILPPPLPRPPPRPSGPPPDPPFAPFILGGSSYHGTPGPSTGEALVGILVVAMILIGVAQQAGLMQACSRAKNWGMQRVSQKDDLRDRRGGKKKGKRRSKNRGWEQEELGLDTCEDDAGAAHQPSELVKPIKPARTLGDLARGPLISDAVPDAFPEPFNPSASSPAAAPPTAECLLVLECEHAVGLLASAKRILQDDNSCILSEVAATTLVRDGDVWTRMTGTVSIQAVGSEADAIRTRVVEELRNTLSTVKFSLTLERKPEARLEGAGQCHQGHEGVM